MEIILLFLSSILSEAIHVLYTSMGAFLAVSLLLYGMYATAKSIIGDILFIAIKNAVKKLGRKKPVFRDNLVYTEPTSEFIASPTFEEKFAFP